MMSRAYQLGWIPPRPPLAAFVGILAGLAVGMTAAWSLPLAFALAVVLVIVLACAVRSAAILMAMTASVFVEAVTLGGTDVSRLVAPVAVFVLLVALLRGEAALRYGAPLAWACAYSLWAVASGLWTVSFNSTTSQLGSLAIALAYMLGFAGLLSSRVDLERVLGFLAVASFGVGAFAIFSYLTHGSFDLKAGRASGGQGDPNFFAAYQVVAIPLMLVLAGDMRRRWMRAGLYLAVAVAIASVLTTLSRGGLVALAVVVILTLMLPSRTLFRSSAHKTTVAVAILLVGGLAFQAVSGTFAPRLNDLLSKGGGSGRIVLWQGAVTAIKERPLTGIGYGSYRSASDNLILRTPGVSLQFFELPPRGQVVHSAYLGTAAELGLPGLLLFLGMLISTGRALRRVASRARAARAWFVSRIANALIVALTGWAIASIFLSSETSRPFWIVIGITLALPKLLEEAAPRSPAR